MSHRQYRHLAILHGEVDLRPQAVRPSAEASAEGSSESDGAAQDSAVLQVGELAKLTGKTVRAIHLYEDMGLLRPVERSRGRFRLYNADSVERVRWIGKLQAVGFSLPDMKKLMEEQASARTGKQAALILRKAYVEKLVEVQGKLSELHRLEQELLSSLTYLDACQSACVDEVNKESCPECERHLDQPEAPSLVLGALVH